MEFPDYSLVDIETLIPYARNSRTHSQEQIDQIADSIREFGFLNPVIIDEDNGIIAGHGRVMAAKQVGLYELPCLYVTSLTDAQKAAYIIADNKLALNAGWDDSILRIELSTLSGEGFDLRLTGFSDEELSDIFSQDIQPLEVESMKEEIKCTVYCDTDEQMTSLKNWLNDEGYRFK